MTVPKTTLFESDDETEVEAKKPARKKATKSRGASADLGRELEQSLVNHWQSLLSNLMASQWPPVDSVLRS